MSEFIRAENLCFSYEEDKNAHPAVKNFSVSIRKGEYVALLGHNGSGKSTFAKLLNMILTPTSGRLFVAGEELTAEGFDEEALFRLRAKVGMVFQNPDNQIVASVVEEDVAFGPENLGVPYDEMHKRVEDALKAVGMTEYAKHSPARLSGGQKQRVAIAGVIAMMPKCIIFDESTAMLDPGGRREVLRTIEKLNREYGITVINITHYMNEAAMADRVIVINDGKLLMDGTPDEIFSKWEALCEVGLDVPQCAELVHRLRKAGIPLEGDHLSTVEGSAEILMRAFAKLES